MQGEQKQKLHELYEQRIRLTEQLARVDEAIRQTLLQTMLQKRITVVDADDVDLLVYG